MDGYAVSQGMPDLRTLPLDRFVNFVWHMLVRNADDTEKQKLMAKIWRPPLNATSIDKRSPWSPENETKAFAALKAATGGGIKMKSDQAAPPSGPRRAPSRPKLANGEQAF